MKLALRLENVRLTKENQGEAVEILRGINLNIPSQAIYTIIGPSGSGKSTLLLLLNRMLDCTQGEIYIQDKPIGKLGVIDLRRKVGMVFQNPTLFPSTVGENILYGPKLQGNAEITSAEKMLELVGLKASFLDRSPDNLSGGETQRVAIARAIANKPEVLLLDEPTSALDPTATKEIEELVIDLNRQLGITIVWVTHDLEQAKRVGTITLLLEKGKVIAEESTQDFFSHRKE
jgi:putative ABC transport system ATP-binding protein